MEELAESEPEPQNSAPFDGQILTSPIFAGFLIEAAGAMEEPASRKPAPLDAPVVRGGTATRRRAGGTK